MYTFIGLNFLLLVQICLQVSISIEISFGDDYYNISTFISLFQIYLFIYFKFF